MLHIAVPRETVLRYAVHLRKVAGLCLPIIDRALVVTPAKTQAFKHDLLTVGWAESGSGSLGLMACCPSPVIHVSNVCAYYGADSRHVWGMITSTNEEAHYHLVFGT
jgi:hypothetical protein